MQVQAWAKALGMEHCALAWTGEKPTSGLQAAARVARYGLLSAYCRAKAVDVLLTGHTANDQAETVAMRQRRTASDESLAGIWPRIDWNGVRIERPLLAVTRGALRTWLLSIGQEWLEDPSNDNPIFERVRIRQSLDARDIAVFTRTAAEAQRKASKNRLEALDFLRAEIIGHAEGYFTAGRSKLALLDAGPADALLVILIEAVGGHRVSRIERENLWHWLAPGGTEKADLRRTLGGVLVAKRSREILFMREPARVHAIPVQIPKAGTLIWDGRFRITGPAGSWVAAGGDFTAAGGRKGVPAAVQKGFPRLLQGADADKLGEIDGTSKYSVEFISLRKIYQASEAWNS
jgi:tRNA(Ile)-lysidine synthase